MNKTIQRKFLQPFFVGAFAAMWTAAAGFAAPSTQTVGARARVAAPAVATASTADAATIDVFYTAMERLAQALHGVVVPNASGGLPKLRGYVDADALANEVLGIASTLRDQNAVVAATQAPI